MKLKDYVTLGNLLGGFLSVVMVIRGDFDWACYLILVAYACDVLDGVVARLTRQFDRFGSALDSTCDFVSYSIAPSFLVYHAFSVKAGYPWPVAAALGALPAVFGTLRQARYAVKRMDYPCYWLGLPRPVLALFILALLRSSLFALGDTLLPHRLAYHLVAVVLAFLAALHLSSFPFASHHGRRFMGWLKAGMVWFLGVTPAAGLLAWLVLDLSGFIWDMLVYDMFVYVFASWVLIPARDFARIRHYLRTGEVILPLCHKDGTWSPGADVLVFWWDRKNLASEPYLAGEVAGAGASPAVES